MIGVGADASAMLLRLGMSEAMGAQMAARLQASPADAKVLLHTMVALSANAALMGAPLVPQGFVPSARAMLHAAGAHFSTVSREAPFGTGSVGRSVERAIQRNPLFRGMLERALGGVVVSDGRNDGRLTVFHPQRGLIGQALRELAQGPLVDALANNGLRLGAGGPIQRSLMRTAENFTSLLRGAGDDGQGLIAGKEDAALAKAVGFDPANASFEEILTFLLMKYAAKKEREIMGKVKALDKAMKAADDAKGQTVGGAFGGLEGLQAANSETIDGKPIGEMSDTLKQQMLQKLMSDLQKMYEMLSNVMKAMDATENTIIRNMRG